MQTNLAPQYVGTPEGEAAEAILRKCVHCGFCTATCPTYQLLGDELDGPRGRIYLMKQVFEGATPTRATQQHLDRCLTCRNCESTCPSGVQYGHLVDVGRKVVDAQVPRPLGERVLRWALKEGLPSPLFAPAMKLGQAVRGVLPAKLKAKVPAPQAAGAWPTQTHARKVLMLAGCVQPAMLPNINTATARVLNAAGIQTVVAPKAGCCGAVKFHLNDQDGGMAHMRANIDAWWPFVEQGSPNEVEAIVMNASGCGVMVKDYGHVLKDDAAYAAKAKRISELTQDLSELLPDLVPVLKPKLNPAALANAGMQAFHPPCTLQHGQQLKGGVEKHLAELGFAIQVANTEAHLCCGSAGTYSVLNPEISTTLRDRKLGHLDALQPKAILSANVGCITHLQSGTDVPVKHWVEVLDAALN
ncbi:glycolate oxidase iron-sulfur subunit [Limnohabitans sp. TS-CS-82]|uniref:glycolate oxidase subunit GlcF n=1 Tax=Limnohabitans sp. TS-CS-82 TaxID=2094193 RepID=UPI000CF25B19|nr:glycolate oxidase subunit GlcF [Limnohabitans sp. TS-CS-82]PQA79844.1 glycolate oxidase iron-sulfur subunit [Limnohabitans sp. TS-CS-82]